MPTPIITRKENGINFLNSNLNVSLLRAISTHVGTLEYYLQIVYLKSNLVYSDLIRKKFYT